MKRLTMSSALNFYRLANIRKGETQGANALPSIAQLVERRTGVNDLISLGRWFESGSKDSFTILTWSPIKCSYGTTKLILSSLGSVLM